MSEQLIKTPCAFGDNGNFLLERELGSGGMGGVYMGRDKMLDRPVAVKVMLRELGSDAEFVEKFKKEAQSVAKLIHPNIAQVYSYGICDNMPYIAMELASGGSLFSLMNQAKGKTDITRVVKICQQVAQALQCAADQGFVHGDVKPENILLDANGNAKLVDFGLAGMQKQTDEIWGTPYYISPEKVKKEPVDFRADMYSLGGTLYHALTGVAPFEGTDPVEVVKKRFEGQPKLPSAIRPEISSEIDNLVMTMLAFDKDDRYPSFESLIEAFKAVMATGLTTRIPSSSVPRRKTIRMRGTVSVKRPVAVTPDDDVEASDSQQEEKSSDNLAGKVVGVVIGVVVLVAAVIGGLVWYTVADKKARAEREQQQIVGEIAKARKAISDTSSSVTKLASEVEAFAASAIAECEKPTRALKGVLADEHWNMLNPGPSQALLDALAAQIAAEGGSDASNGAPDAAVVNARLKDLLKGVSSCEPGVAKDAVPQDAPDVVTTMNELWERAYGCLASSIAVRREFDKALKACEKADAIRGETREDMQALGDLSRSAVELLEAARGSKDVENIRRGIGFIKDKGKKTVAQTIERIRVENLQKAREEAKKKAEEEDKARQERLAKEKAERVEAEIGKAAAAFEEQVNYGLIRQMNWKTALINLENAKQAMTSAEGQLAADFEIRKVSDMKKVQDILVANLSNYQFTKPVLRGYRVIAVDNSEIRVQRDKDVKKITWSSFVKKDYNNLVEVLNRFVFNGRKNLRLSAREVSDALIGGALLFKYVCEEASAAGFSEMLAKEAVKQFPQCGDDVRKIFPDIQLDGSVEE